jgi:DNA-binding MarR family transcriptional regulator/GNAT superfamily N-acetyltransferase
MTASPATRQIDAVRSFNRFYTRRIGVLEEGLLESPFTLTQARVLFELAQSHEPLAKEIGARLGLDAGYLSRILKDFAKRKLITRQRSPGDSRQVVLALTPQGRKAFQLLDRRSHRSVARMLSGMRSSDRQRLLASLREIRTTLAPETASKSGEVRLRTHRSGDIGWAIALHGELYAQEFGWNVEFEGLVATLFGSFARKHDPAAERLWVAELDGERVGCAFVVRTQDDARAAQLRCLLVDPKARGKGVGRVLVRECISFARSAGYERILLWTNDVLVAARRIYEAEGFQLLAENPHHSFGKDLIGQTWMRPL